MKGRHRWLLPLDITVFAVNTFLGLCSLLFIGRLRIDAFGTAIDRELVVGLGFLAVNGVLLWALPRLHRSEHDLLRFVRIFYPQLLYAAYFTECIQLSQLVYGGLSLDPFFAQLEELLFGMQPAVHFAEALGRAPAVNELFFFGYFFYYLLITSGFWLLFLRGQADRAARCVFIVSTSFAILYVWYVFFPVHGPKYFIDVLHVRYYAEFDGFLFTAFMSRVLRNTNLAGAAFPSSHVAIAIVALLLNRRYNPVLAAVYLPMTLLLMASTVYIYAHYAVDVIAGALLGPFLFLLVTRLYPLGIRLAAGSRAGPPRRMSRS